MRSNAQWGALILGVAFLLAGVMGLYGRIGAATYAALVVIAFLSPTLFGLAPIGGNDIWLHAVFAAGLAWVGFAGDKRTAIPPAMPH